MNTDRLASKVGLREEVAREIRFLILGVAVALLSVGAAIISSGIILDRFATLQRESAAAVSQGVLQALDLRAEAMLGIASEYANWDSAADFAEGKSPDFLEDELFDNTFLFNSVNAMLFFDRAGEFIGGRAMQPDGVLGPVPESLATAVGRSKSFLHPPRVESGSVGFVSANDEVFFVVCRTITASDLSGPHRGSLVVASRFDTEMMRKLEALTRVSMRITPITPGTGPASSDVVYSRLLGGSLLFVDGTDPVTNAPTAHALLKDVTGAHSILMDMVLPGRLRELAVTAENVLRFSTLGVAAIFIAYALFMVWELARRRRELTERVLEQEALAKAKEEAEQLAERATAADRAKSEFLAMMSHEVRTPLNAVLGFSELLFHGELSPEQRNHVETIQSSGKILLAVINDILDFSKIEAGKIQLQYEPLQVRQAVADVVRLFAHEAQSKHIELRTEFAADAPTQIVTDSTRFAQVLVNLLSNAVKFTSEGGVLVRVGRCHPAELAQHEIRAQEGSTFLRVSVHDSGVGIPEAERHKLFKTFTQLDSSTTRRFGGTGLGLAISRRLCQMMGGDIWLAGSDHGAEFVFAVRSNE